MDLVTTLLVRVPAQIVVFTLVPLAYWLHVGRPDGSLLRWLGFRGVRGATEPRVLAAAGLCAAGFFGSALQAGPVLWPSWGSGLIAVLTVPITAVLQTALAEEVFFRGFLLRWLGEKRPEGKRSAEKRFGPVVANLLQASLCGLLSAATYWLLVSRAPEPNLAAFAMTAGSAFLAGWLKQHTGSILLPWATHGAGNLVAGLILVLTR